MSDQGESAGESSSGRRTVLGMFCFGLLMVGALWLYWELYTRPFRPLQNAIAAAYPGSRPSVIGGRHKSHQEGNPHVLRIVLQMPDEDFNPEADKAKAEQRALELARLAEQHVPLANYEVLEIHLVQRLPEQPQRHSSVSHSVKEWMKRLSEKAEEQPSTPQPSTFNP
ncbi:hypothetical protein SH661x_000128 [Planctomicrobium sp. SH661]|uniref:hypothetical protein n=1 Tax=Planctomicrobium sp. SH661 TaxID=3448124 RepID=UPI003F5C2D62